MIAECAKSVPSGEEWIFEPFFAGERVLAVKDHVGVRFQTIAHSKDVTNRFPALAALVARLPATTLVLEATLCCIDAWQQDAFAGWESVSAPPFGSAAMRLIATDLLWFDEMDIRQCALHDRKSRLRQLIAGTSALEPLPLTGPHPELFARARRMGAESVVAKRRNSRYRPFARPGDWVRVHVEVTSPRSGDAEPNTELELAH